MDTEENSSSSVTPDSFGDNPVLNAVNALLLSRQHRSSKEDVLPLSAQLLVLTKAQNKNTVEANLGSGQGSGYDKADDFDAFIPSLEQVHALATANLLASTQRDIAQQLAEASSNSDTKTQTNKRHQQSRSSPTKKKDVRKNNSLSDSDFLTSVPKALTCSFSGCNRQFASATHLKYHEMTHTDNRQFECPDENCAKTFYTAQRLKVHLRTHTGEKPFKCSHADCGKTFTTAGNLKNHKRIHTGEQPFMCDFDGCDRRFTEYSSLHKHKLTHSGDKPFECKICNKKFTQSGSRRQHLIRHHLDEEIRNSLKASRYKTERPHNVTERNSETVADAHDLVNGESVPGKPNVSCSPQLTLSNDFHSQTSSESIVDDHLVSLMSGSNHHHVSIPSCHQHHHHVTEPSNISSSHSLLNGVYEVTLNNKPSELVALSQASVFHSEEQDHDILCASDMLDHEEITHANFVSQENAPEEMVTPLGYHHHNGISIQTDVSLHHSCESDQSGTYQNHQDYIQHEDLHHHNTDDYNAEVKGNISSSYLTPDGEVLHEEFIETKEVTISSSSGPADVSEEDPSYIPVRECVSALIDWNGHIHKH